MSIEKELNYNGLFNMWADFDDTEASEEVAVNLIEEHGLGPVDSVSFAAFCYGYERAVAIIEEAL